MVKEEGVVKLALRSVCHVLDRNSLAPFSYRLLGPVLHHKLVAWPRLGYVPNIRQPQTFNEKVLHRMVFDPEGIRTRFSDKYSTRQYVAKCVGEDVLPELYHVTDDPGTIRFDLLPDDYVIKATLGSKNTAVVKSSEDWNAEELEELCRKWVSNKYGPHLNHFKPRIMVEERLPGGEHDVPLDYKFYVFHGAVAYVHVDFDRGRGRSMRFFDREWRAQEFQKGKNRLGPAIEKPRRFREMVNIAEELGGGFSFVRVDLYHLNDGRIVFGELTSAPGSGQSPFKPVARDYEMGCLW